MQSRTATEHQMAVLKRFFKGVGTTIHGAQTRDGEEGMAVVVGTVCQVSEHLAQKVVTELIEKTRLLPLPLLLLLPKPPSVACLWCDERQCFELKMPTNGIRRAFGRKGGRVRKQRAAAAGRVVFVSSSYADIALRTDGRKGGWRWRRGGRRQGNAWNCMTGSWARAARAEEKVVAHGLGQGEGGEAQDG